VQVTAMSDEWLTYEEVAVRLGVTLRAARARAFRGRWSKTVGNDGRARVRLPDEPRAPVRSMTVRPTESVLVTALEGHVATLKADVERLEADLAAERARADKQATVSAAQLAAAEARAERQAADFAARDAERIADLTAERAKTMQAIEAFSALAERLDALAAERARPWWKRIAG
jgi:hypothetical protein